ncbi:thioredoxin family protein [Salsuginibacillus kocurii]|uniref:thioredoxin family protein n=1 Tax=Salsuginibacillus kocurii TaxID=427078 RepID=UPI0003619C49|nr:thioredoxin domain-containing protein [Salsuginibacillus kocurii]
MIEVNKKNFTEEVLQADKPVIVDFWGPSCQPCLTLMPEVEQLSHTYHEQVKLVKLNSAENRKLCIQYRVMGLPAFLLFKDGEVVKRISGDSLTKDDIEALINESLGVSHY